MTPREQALRERIEEMANAAANEPQGPGNSLTRREWKCVANAFYAGANSLLPLLLEMAATLEKYKHISLQKGATHYSEAAEALSSLDRFLSGGEK